MRTLIFCFLFLAPAMLQAGDTRIAHVDSKIIFEGYKGTKKAQDEYDKQVAKWEQQANLLQKELASIKERLDKQSLMLSDEKKRSLEAEFGKKEAELKDFVNRIYGREGEIVQENEKVSAPIIKKIREIVNEVAVREGYDYVLDRASGAVVFWKSGDDLTQRVLDELNGR